MHALRHYRKQNGLSLEALANKVGTSKATLCRLETDKGMGTADVALLRKLVTETGIPAEQLHSGLAALLKQKEAA